MEHQPENTASECPVCLGHMEPEDRDGVAWLVCPNGCPTEFEAPVVEAPVAVVELHKIAAA